MALDGASFDTVLLFGVIPSPMLPLNRLLPELHRVLKENGSLAIWLPFRPGGSPSQSLNQGYFRTHVSGTAYTTSQESATPSP